MYLNGVSDRLSFFIWLIPTGRVVGWGGGGGGRGLWSGTGGRRGERVSSKAGNLKVILVAAHLSFPLRNIQVTSQPL